MSQWLLSGVAFVLGLALLTTGTAVAAVVGLLAVSIGLVGAAAQTGRLLGRGGER